MYNPKEEILNCLKRIKDEGPFDEEFGICYSIEMIITNGKSYYQDILTEIWKEWPKYSGQSNYPIGKGKEDFNTHSLFWDRRTQYGRDRWELLDFLIEKLEG